MTFHEMNNKSRGRQHYCKVCHNNTFDIWLNRDFSFTLFSLTGIMGKGMEGSLIHKKGGLPRGTHVSGPWLLHTGYWAYGLCGRSDGNGFAVLLANRLFRPFRLSEAYRENLYPAVLGIYDRRIYRFQLLDGLQNGFTPLIPNRISISKRRFGMMLERLFS